MKTLQTIKQGKQSADKHNTWFKLLLSKAGIDPTQQALLIIELYAQSLNDHLRCQIILNGELPKMLEEYMLKASAVDCAFRSISMRGVFSKGVRGKGYSRPATYWPSAQKQSSSTNYGEPMDVDRMLALPIGETKGRITMGTTKEKGRLHRRNPSSRMRISSRLTYAPLPSKIVKKWKNLRKRNSLPSWKEM